MNITEYLGDWTKVMDLDKLTTILHKLSLEYRTKDIAPKQSNIFKAFKLCPLDKLRVVMLFQDPYPQKGVATGIALGNSTNTPEQELSPSLKIVKEAAINFEIPHYSIIFDNTLESWARQGILMLNSALTVEVNRIGSHTMLWRPFISSLIQNLSNYRTDLIFVLFGRQAQSFKPYISKHFNYILEIEHPAYFARNNKRIPVEFFSNLNCLVEQCYKESIKWYNEY